MVLQVLPGSPKGWETPLLVREGKKERFALDAQVAVRNFWQTGQEGEDTSTVSDGDGGEELTKRAHGEHGAEAFDLELPKRTYLIVTK